MLISLLRWLAFTVSLSLLLVYFKGGTSIVKYTKRSIDAERGYIYLAFTILMSLAGGTILLTQCLICVGIVQVVAWAGQWWIVTLGTILVVSGILAAYWIRYRYLGRFWSGSVEIQVRHEVIETGPYRIVRHPLYALTPVIYSGAALSFAVWWNWIACGVMIIGYIWLTAYEDKFLEVYLPGYQEYQQRTRYRLVPGVW
jgi:protein-S-isoprenylcysteine O-methyltransferase Ste14